MSGVVVTVRRGGVDGVEPDGADAVHFVGPWLLFSYARTRTVAGTAYLAISRGPTVGYDDWGHLWCRPFGLPQNSQLATTVVYRRKSGILHIPH